jgi:hypothetical protein
MVPPRRLTHEHEAAHCVVAHRGGGIVSHIEVAISQLPDGRISLGRAVWGPAGNQNTMLACYAAGPAQTKISVHRDALDPIIADESLQQEGTDLAAMLQEKTGKPNLPSAAILILTPPMTKLVAYLCNPIVQEAVTTIADATEAAEHRGETHVHWSKLVPLVQWNELPPLPTL